MKHCTRQRLTFPRLTVLGVALGLLCAAPAGAGEWAFVGARYQGMGGAGVATVNDSFASYWNPAALGTGQSYDVASDVGIAGSVEAEVLQSVDDIENMVDSAEFAVLVGELATPGLSAPAQATFDQLEALLLELAAPGDGVVGNAGSGFNMRWEKIAVFTRALADFAVSPVSDLDAVLEAPDTNPLSILNNDSGARVRGLGIVEAGVGYGHSFFDGLVSVGANIKYMRGIAFDKYVNYRTIEDASLSFSDSSLRTESNSFGIDLGIMAQPFDFLRVGMVARNINSPSFSVSSSPGDPSPRGSFRLEPQVRGGVAVYPFSNDFLVIAMDMDFTKNKSDLIDNYDSQLWSFGAEVNVPLWVLDVSVRGGGYMNTASNASNAFAFTGGLGLRVWLLSLDLAGGISAKESEVSGGDKFPSRVNGSVVLAIRGDF